MAKVMLITGGSRGIGAATARLAARRGYDVCISYKQDKDAANGVIEHIENAGRKALAVQTNIANEEQIKALFDQVDEFGTLSVLVNNAAVLEPQMRLETMTAERMKHIFHVNVIGSFLCAREAVLRISTNHGGKGGAIINLSSAASRVGSAGEYVDYAASKGAIDTFTLGLAREVATEGIRVNAVRPGFIDTDIHASGGEPERMARVRDSIPLGRVGLPEEIAEAILWLASEEASYTTGAILDVTGAR